MKFIPFILICALNIPDSECQIGKKDVTITIGEYQNTPIGCLIEGQTKIASLILAPKENDNYYVRIKCVPKIIEN